MAFRHAVHSISCETCCNSEAWRPLCNCQMKCISGTSEASGVWKLRFVCQIMAGNKLHSARHGITGSGNQARWPVETGILWLTSHAAPSQTVIFFLTFFDPPTDVILAYACFLWAPGHPVFLLLGFSSACCSLVFPPSACPVVWKSQRNIHSFMKKKLFMKVMESIDAILGLWGKKNDESVKCLFEATSVITRNDLLKGLWKFSLEDRCPLTPADPSARPAGLGREGTGGGREPSLGRRQAPGSCSFIGK